MLVERTHAFAKNFIIEILPRMKETIWFEGIFV